MDVKPAKRKEPNIRIIIVARHKLVQEGLRHLIEGSGEFTVSATCNLDGEINNSTGQLKSDVAVVYLDGLESVGKVAEVREAVSGVRVVVVTDGSDLEIQTRAIKMGAVGIVRAEQSAKLLIEAIRQTYKGETWLNQALLNKILENDRLPVKKSSNGAKSFGIESLTAREIEVIQMIGKGLKSKAIAKQLYISEATVRHHLSSIYGKLGVEDRLNLVIFAYQKGLIQLSEMSAGV